MLRDAQSKASSKLSRMAKKGAIAKKARSDDASPAASPAEPERAAAGGQVATEKIIERQVIVARCRFCKELTPVDLEACKNCGGKGFA